MNLARSITGLMAGIFVLATAGEMSNGCHTSPPHPPLSRFAFNGPCMGTLWHMTVYAPDHATASNAVSAAFDRIIALNAIMTDYDPDSELMRLSKSPQGVPVKVSDDLFKVISAAQEISKSSDGAFDITAGPIVQLWRRARRQHELPRLDRLSEAMKSVGWKYLALNEKNKTITLLTNNIRLDLGGIAKGYGADEALKTLRSFGLSRSLVAASGDLAIGDPPPDRPGWRIAIGIPGSKSNHSGWLILKNAGVSTSGDTEQFVELDGVKYSHIVDPRTGRGLTNRFQSTIIARCTTESDALATTVCVMGAEKGRQLIESRRGTVCLVLQPGEPEIAIKSKGFPSLISQQDEKAGEK